MKDRKKVQWAWAMYDWANSAYQLVIVTAIFPIYYNAIMPETVNWFGEPLESNALYLYALSLAYLIVAFSSPILSSLADYKSNKLSYMKFFTFMGAISCMCLYFFTEDYQFVGIVGLILSTVGYKSSFVFYNAFLPEVATKEEQNRLSAFGYTLGYLGSTGLLIFSLSMIMMPDLYGMNGAGMASRITLLVVGVWWIGFSMIPFKHLPQGEGGEKESLLKTIKSGYQVLLSTFGEVHQLPRLRTFLGAYFFLIMGVQTVFYSATLFGKDELKLEDDMLIITMLVIQFVGALGAYLCAKWADKYGDFKIMYFVAFVWTAVTIAAFFITTSTQFIVASFFIGFVMGGIQSNTRSTYSKLLPETKDRASFFSLYDVMENLAIVIGTMSVGFLINWFGNMRQPILLIAGFFVIGIIFLIFAHRSNRLHQSN